jgi:hypothetical protein
MIEEFNPMTCGICSQFLGWYFFDKYFFDKTVQIKFTVHCGNCQIRLMKTKNIPRRLT